MFASKPYVSQCKDVEFYERKCNVKKNILIIILLLIFLFVFIRITTSTYENIKRRNNAPVQDQEMIIGETKSDGDITPISVDDVKGITGQEAEKLCYYVMGEKDEDTGFAFSFGTSGAVQKGEKQGDYKDRNDYTKFLPRFGTSG